MTDKRFTLNSVLNFDFGICDYGEPIGSLKNICELLNELHKEKEQLKDALNQRTDQCDEYYKENEQLKKQLESEHQMLENAILLERTRMGKNCLKQYKEAIQ